MACGACAGCCGSCRRGRGRRRPWRRAGRCVGRAGTARRRRCRGRRSRPGRPGSGRCRRRGRWTAGQVGGHRRCPRSPPRSSGSRSGHRGLDEISNLRKGGWRCSYSHPARKRCPSDYRQKAVRPTPPATTPRAHPGTSQAAGLRCPARDRSRFGQALKIITLLQIRTGRQPPKLVKLNLPARPVSRRPPPSASVRANLPGETRGPYLIRAFPEVAARPLTRKALATGHGRPSCTPRHSFRHFDARILNAPTRHPRCRHEPHPPLRRHRIV